MKLTVQGEVVAGTILQQSFIVEYVVNHQMCDECRRIEAKDTWNANVSVNRIIRTTTFMFNFSKLFLLESCQISNIYFPVGSTETKNRSKENSLLC